MSDFIPHREAEFLRFATAFNAAAGVHAGILGIPAAQITAQNAAVTAYTAAYHTCEKPNAGKLDREERKEKRAGLEASIRKMKNAYIDADPLGVVTDEIRMDFGLPPKDAARTPVPDPEDAVPFTLEDGGYLQVTVRHPPRPERYNGAVAFFTTGPAPAAGHGELTRSKLLTRPKETLTFDDAELGTTLSIALRWQNEKGRLGPWPPIQTRVIS
jgi:hypothetical protein